MKAALLLSGGVDSSVALHLLRQAGHEAECFYLKIWLEEDQVSLGDCPWEEDLENAHAVADAYGAPLHIVSLQKEYYDLVVGESLEELRLGRTPSPDIWCNSRIKFGAFLEAIEKRGASFDKIASGHYAQVEEKDGLYHLLKAKDPVKDQTYFLSRLSQSQLSKLAFPIGHLLKSEVRGIAREANLYNQDRKDSQGVCFLGKIRYRDFVRHHLGEKEGLIVDQATGKVLGKHSGVWFYTIGQRQGLGLSGGPWFVSAKKTESNVLVVTRAQSGLAGNKNYFYVEDVHWISRPHGEGRYEVKIRHSPTYFHAFFRKIEGGFLVELEEEDQGIASGQSVVLYKNEVCLGSAFIRTEKPGLEKHKEDLAYG